MAEAGTKEPDENIRVPDALTPVSTASSSRGIAYADGEGGIGLTATGAMSRKFVHWAAVNFLWPNLTAKDLHSMNKVLNEGNMPPLWVVRDMARHLKLLRRKKDVLLPTRRGREFLVKPQAFSRFKAR
jgi:hypothetical protein